MKFFAIFTVLAMANCQDPNTVTDDLLASQAELTIGHEFTEILLVQNRDRVSNYLQSMEISILDSYMDAYASIKTRAVQTREDMLENSEPSTCRDAVRARYELQITRYGRKLADCLEFSRRYFLEIFITHFFILLTFTTTAF